MKVSTYNKHHRSLYTLVRKKCYLVFVVLSVLSFVHSVSATDYYFSSSAGNDSRTSAQAQNSSTPWRSIEKLNSISGSLKGGDRILFKTGDVFYGTVRITKSGSTGAPILFTSYGSGAKPIISSLVKISNFISVGNGKYEADLSSYNINTLQVALINNQIKEVGRYPNTDAADGGYLRIANVNSNSSISTPSANPFGGSTGDVVIRKNNWIIDRHAIASIGGNSISFYPNGSQYNPQKNYGYFLQNHASLLDRPGEWSYDSRSKILTVNLSGYDMNTVNVSVATLDNLVINNQYTTNLSFSNIHFKGANSHLLNISKSENVKIENCKLEYAGVNAISSSDIRGFVVQNNEINYSLNSAIFIAYGSPGAIIRGNTITYTFPFQGMAKSSDMSGIGIYLASDGDGSLIEKNNLINSGFNGIHFGGSYTRVINNFIDNFCLYKQDGGGIYTNSDGMRTRNNVGREITGNIILNGKGTRLGTTEEVDMAEGIYLDDNSAGVNVSKNTIAFVSGKGLYLHNANNIEISENLFYKAKTQVQFTHDFMGDPIRNVNVTKNQFSSTDKTQQVYSISSSQNDIGSVGSFSSNYFLDPFYNDFFIQTKSSYDGPTGVSRNIGNWASSFGFDNNSTRPELNIANYKITSSIVLKESDFSVNTSLISGVYGATSQLVSSGITGGTLKLRSNSSNNATVYIQIGSVKIGDKILVEFDMKGTPANIPVELFLEDTYNVDKGAGNGKVSTTLNTKSQKVLLSAQVTKSNESIVLRFPPSASEVLLDNMKISKVTVDETDEASLIFFAYNPTGTAVQKSLDGTYKNAKNETFSSSVTIPAWGSVLLAKTSAVTAPAENKAPTVSLTKPTEGQVFINGVHPVQLVADAKDPEGKIKKVEFYNGTTLLSSLTAAPFIYDWTNIQNGNYQVYAKVFDQEDLAAISNKVNFSVKNEEIAPLPYSPQIISPINNSTFELGSKNVVLKTDASSAGIDVQKVEFYNWGYPLITVTTGNFEFNWTAIEVDTYNITAKITDKSGKNYMTPAIKFTVKASSTVTPPQDTDPVNSAPLTVAMTAPYDNQVFELGKTPVILKAATSKSVSKVEFFNWYFPLVEVSNSTNEFNWSKIEPGSYFVSARITDENGKTFDSAPVRFKVLSPNSRITADTTVTNQDSLAATGVDSTALANSVNPSNSIASADNSQPSDQKNSSGFGIKMGPNPTSSHLNIFLEDYPENYEGKVSVVDLRGVEVFNTSFNTDQKTLTLQLSSLKPGIYVVKLSFGNKYFQTRKLIKS